MASTPALAARTDGQQRLSERPAIAGISSQQPCAMPGTPAATSIETALRPSLYATHIGKKYAMAISGTVMMLFVFFHMLGNLKLYLGPGEMNAYARWLRDVGAPAIPHEVLLDVVNVALVAALGVHLTSAVSLTRINRRARPEAYRSPRDYGAASFASRTIRWTGIIVAAFVVFHLFDLTWGTANPDFRSGDPYHNVVVSFQRWPVAAVYIVANLALGIHLYHGAWSLFQSLGWVPRWRRRFATAFALIVAVGNISFPIAVLLGVIS
jgi:succinate dehydrogenase cytochrome b subunit